jgi:hypothetical protein
MNSDLDMGPLMGIMMVMLMMSMFAQPSNGEPTPESGFEISDLSIDPMNVGIGEPTEISALVTNVGGSAATCTVDCEVSPTTFTTLQVSTAVDNQTIAQIVGFSMIVLGMIWYMKASKDIK